MDLYKVIFWSGFCSIFPRESVTFICSKCWLFFILIGPFCGEQCIVCFISKKIKKKKVRALSQCYCYFILYWMLETLRSSWTMPSHCSKASDGSVVFTPKYNLSESFFKFLYSTLKITIMQGFQNNFICLKPHVHESHVRDVGLGTRLGKKVSLKDIIELCKILNLFIYTLYETGVEKENLTSIYTYIFNPVHEIQAWTAQLIVTGRM